MSYTTAAPAATELNGRRPPARGRLIVQAWRLPGVITDLRALGLAVCALAAAVPEPGYITVDYGPHQQIDEVLVYQEQQISAHLANAVLAH